MTKVNGTTIEFATAVYGLALRMRITEAELAKKLKISARTLVNWKKDPFKIPLGKLIELEKIANRNETTVQVFFT